MLSLLLSCNSVATNSGEVAGQRSIGPSPSATEGFETLPHGLVCDLERWFQLLVAAHPKGGWTFAQHHQTDQSISSPVSWRPLTNDTVWAGGELINLINTLQHHAVAAILAFLDAP